MARSTRSISMPDDDQILQQLLAQLRSRVGNSVRVLEEGSGRLTLQIGPDETAILGVRVHDPSRPSFSVSYPKRKFKSDGSRVVQDVVGDGLLMQGVEWIAHQLAKHGVVPPEFDRSST
jgi:hypothetical protein